MNGLDKDRSVLVAAYWKQHQLRQGDRAQRLEAEEYFWAWEVISDAAHDGDEGILDLIDDLLHADNAEPSYVGAGPIEDLLGYHGERFAGGIAERCRRDAAWRDALSVVVYSGVAAAAVERLRPWLRPIPAEAARTGAEGARKESVKRNPTAPTRGRGRRDR